MLWALGLVQESKVLGEGPIKQRETAKTPSRVMPQPAGGHWEQACHGTLQQRAPDRPDPRTRRVGLSVAENIFRPCCGNHTAFPDCNHGMAVLGLLELLASQGATER